MRTYATDLQLWLRHLSMLWLSLHESQARSWYAFYPKILFISSLNIFDSSHFLHVDFDSSMATDLVFLVFDLWPVPESFIILNIFTLPKPSSCQSIVNVCRWPRKWGLIFENMGFVNENKHSMNWTMSPIFDYAKRTTFICVINETNAMEMEKSARYYGDEKLFLPLIIYSSGGYQLWSLMLLSK